MHMVLSMSIAIKSESLTAARGNIVDDECVAIQKTDIAETVLGDQAEVGIWGIYSPGSGTEVQDSKS